FQVENGRIAELVKLICETPPERPNLDRDLDQILLHALEKEPARRYASAEAFAEDLERYLEGFPVEAQPDSWKYRTGKFVRRHKVGVAVAVCVMLLIVGFGVTMAVLARRLAKQRDLAEVQLHRAEQVSAFMETAFGLADPNQAKGTNPTARDLLDRGAAHINETLKNEPEVRLRLLDTFGNAYKGMGLYKQAEALLRQSLELRRGLYGGQSIEVADALVDDAEAAMRAGDVDDGVSMATESVAVYSALRGRQSEETAVAMDTLCTALFFKGDYGRAEEVSREDAGVWEKLKGPLSLKLHPALNIWGAVLQDKGDYAGAESLYRRQMEIFRSAKTLGQIADSDTETKLGEVLTLEGRYDEAEAFLRQALATRMKMFGTDHSFTGLTELALARALAGRGDADGAEKMFAEALRVHTKAVGPASRYTASDQAGMAQFDESRGRYAEAKRLYGSALETRVKIFGTESRAVMRSRICMARVMVEQGTTRGVAEMLAEAAKAEERFTPRNPRDVAAYAVAEGEFALAERRWAEAEASFRRAVSVLEKDASLGRPEIEEARDGLERASKRDKEQASSNWRLRLRPESAHGAATHGRTSGRG
ncbi:MAG: eukaryotic-like serine/threonine-protein kinase, partial [Acidobacteriaceae bacterium]|nr:eukaryotic-like serine/threonine-protein kinase [Acidobacteriaceae bacterium]